MLRHRVPSAVVMVAWLLTMLALDVWAERRGLLPGTVLLVGVLAPFVWGACREIAVLFAAVGRNVGAATLGGGAATGLLVATLGAATLATSPGIGEPAGGPSALTLPPPGGDALAPASPTDAVEADLLLLTLGLAVVALGWSVLLTCSRTRSAERAIALVSGLAVGFVFIGLLAGSWLWVRALAPAAFMVLAMLVIKSCDIGAYFTGRLVGRTKLIFWLSPGKTREGLAGGMLLSATLAALLWSFTGAGQGASRLPEVPLWAVFASGALLGLVGQVGDLFASALKRAAGVKDYARSIPGFGGVMDVGDSVLLAGPVTAGLLRLGHMLT